MSALERNTEVPTSTRDEDLSPCTNCRGIPRDPSSSHEDWTFLRQQERFPEVHIVTREEPSVSYRNSRKNRKFSAQCEMRPFFTEVSLGKSHLPS